jgi:tellurite methyltransferase
MAREPRSIGFFETRFQHQVGEQDFAPNPFARLALEHVRGRVLDLGCGLGNLAIEAARRGCAVTAVDASPTGVAHTRQTALGQRLSPSAFVADLETWSLDRDYDTIVAIGACSCSSRRTGGWPCWGTSGAMSPPAAGP